MAQGTRSVDTLDDHIQALIKPHRRASNSLNRPGSFQRSGSFVFTSPGDRRDSVSSVSSMSSVSWVEVEDIITTMESLAFHSKQAKRCCNCIIVCYKVAQVRNTGTSIEWVFFYHIPDPIWIRKCWFLWKKKPGVAGEKPLGVMEPGPHWWREIWLLLNVRELVFPNLVPRLISYPSLRSKVGFFRLIT